jgi:hypothetical protein
MGEWKCSCSWCSVRCSHTPIAINRPAISSCAETASPNAMIAATLPMNGAVEKYALVRAVPRPRNASTNKTRLMPYPRKPTTPAISEIEIRGMVAPSKRARIRLNGPAINPFSSTICKGSASETLRVKLLSRPQATQAPTIASGPSTLSWSEHQTKTGSRHRR